MMCETIKHVLSWGIGALIALGASVPVAAKQTIHQRLEAREDGQVEISNVSGSVVVRGWDRAEVLVEGTAGNDVEAVRVETRGSRTVIAVDLPRNKRGRHDLSADLEIHVPAGSGVEVAVVSASLAVDGVDGALDLTSVSGSLRVEGSPSRLEVESVSGAVRVRAQTGTLRASSVSGLLELGGRASEVRANSVSGRVALTTAGAERVEIETVSTSIEIDMDLAPGASIEASSHSGSITLRLAKNASAEINASSFSGRINNDLGPAPERPRHGPGSRLRFTLGEGDGRITLNSFSGAIRIESQ
jgi:DUF4097 and DUF4098 domain-containing protein YvlB